MKYQLVTYRTKTHEFKRHAMVLPLFLSDLTGWLIDEGAKIISVLPVPHVVRAQMHTIQPPDNWPSYGQHKGVVTLLDMIGDSR